MSAKIFPDDPHVERIARALWAREPFGTAALLVGAGFSRNAVSVRPSASAMPGWNDIYKTMVEQLYPAPAEHAALGDGSQNEVRAAPASNRDWLLRQTGATSAYLRVAEEFEAQFGRTALDQLILQHVPDQQFTPGRLHHLLLQLPWADVMTTNWDTLLERAAETTEERVYDIVRTVEEIPGGKSPRVIKLHGSFPAYRPFVFTEEDFRTYPARAGAFVNLAQQLAMENTLVLVGFSGDDPNFLFWSGWVRDRLGPNAPLIYLVGVLGLSAPKRKMLESRRIQPIDLADLPQFDSWPAPRRMEYAHQWFLERLRAAEPYPARRWPRPAAGFVPPLEFATPRTDARAPLPSPDGLHQGEALGILRKLTSYWQQIRSVYPGWIVPPLEVCETIWRDVYGHIVQITKGLKAVENLDEKLAVLFELNWQLEVALAPLDLTVDDVILETLEALLPRYAELPADASAKFRTLALALVRHAREMRSGVMFRRWTEWLQGQTIDDPEQSERLTYELILWTQSEQDIDRLEELVGQWEIGGDSFWALRKAAVLADMGRDTEASDMAAETLAKIRAQTGRRENDIAAWSRESFALFFRSAALRRDFGRWEDNQHVTDRFDIRQEELQGRGCPGRRDFFTLLERLRPEAPPFERLTETKRQFDIGSISFSVRLADSDPRVKRLLALQALRFLEEAGLPIRIGQSGFAVKLLTDAARWLMDAAPARAIDAILRASPTVSNDMFEKLLTRDVIARTSPESANDLLTSLIRTINAAKARITSNRSETRFWRDRMKSALELASRFVLVAPQHGPELLKLAISIHKAEHSSARSEFDRVLHNIISRSLEGMGADDQENMIFEVFSTDIPKDKASRSGFEQDLVHALPVDFRIGNLDARWKKVVTSTIASLSEKNKRLAASHRLNWLKDARALDDEDVREAGTALWSSQFMENGLPSGTIYFPSAFLTFPGAENHDVAGALHTLVIRDDPLTDDVINKGSLTTALEHPQMPLSADDVSRQIDLLIDFVANHAGVSAQRQFLQDNRSDLVENTSKIAAALTRRAIGADLLYGKIASMFALDRYPLRKDLALPYLLKIGLVDVVDASTRLRLLFASSERTDATLARALLHQRAFEVANTDEFQNILWREIGLALAACRSATIPSLLNFCHFVVSEDASLLPGSLDEPINACLMTVLEETKQTSPAEHLQFDPFLARDRAAMLARKLNEHVRLDAALWSKWGEAIANDPLPDTHER